MEVFTRPEFQDLVNTIVMSLLGILAMIAGEALRRGIVHLQATQSNEKLKEYALKLDLLFDFILVCVRHAEQSPAFRALGGPEKFADVIGRAYAYAEKEIDLPIDYQRLGEMIEAAVHMVKQEALRYPEVTELVATVEEAKEAAIEAAA